MANSHGYIKDILTGIFLLAIVGLLAFFTIVISGVDMIRGRNTCARYVRFMDVGALKEQDPVYVRGLKVGSVQSLELLPNAVQVKLILDQQVTLRKDYKVTVGKTSMLGGTCVQITEGTDAEVLPADFPLEGLTPPDMMADLGELVKGLREAINPDELRQTISNIQKASADIAVLTERVQRGEGMVGKLLSDDNSAYEDLSAGLDNFRAITEDLRTGKGLLGKLISEEDNTYAELQSAIANLNKVTEGLANGQGLLGKLMREEDNTYAELKSTISNLNTVTDGLVNGKGLLGKLMREDDSTYADLKAALENIRMVTEKLNDPKSGFGRLLSQDSTLVADLEASAASIRTITAKLENGEGTLGRLVNDDGVAVEMEAAIKDVRQIIDNMRDTAPITTFTSLFFGGL
ncbi:MAG: MCE family protein [Kiritimatiellae bacterium]|nr:MCE family protein [Kiritimatiellia bacterium]